MTQQTPTPNEFQPMSAAAKQPELPSGPLLYGAYSFVWAVLLIYVFFLWRRLSRVEREVADVNQKLKS